MKNAWLMGMALVLGVTVLAACGGGQPDITVAGMRHDFGQVKQGDVVTTEIAVRNGGRGDLIIEAVSTSCGCTTAEVKPEVIPPGGDGKLTVRYNSGAHPDKGPVKRHIYIASNDPDQAEVEVTIMADVQPPAE